MSRTARHAVATATPLYLPQHTGFLHLQHNPHNDENCSVQEFMDDWTSPVC